MPPNKQHKSNNVNPNVLFETPPSLLAPLDDLLQVPPVFTHSATSAHPTHLSQTSGVVPSWNPAQTAVKTVLVVRAPLSATVFTNIVGSTTTPLLVAASISRSRSVFTSSPETPPESSIQDSIFLPSILAFL